MKSQGRFQIIQTSRDSRREYVLIVFDYWPWDCSLCSLLFNCNIQVFVNGFTANQFKLESSKQIASNCKIQHQVNNWLASIRKFLHWTNEWMNKWKERERGRESFQLIPHNHICGIFKRNIDMAYLYRTMTIKNYSNNSFRFSKWMPFSILSFSAITYSHTLTMGPTAWHGVRHLDIIN